MKKLLLISFIFIGSFCQASNLEFNQVILINGNVPFSQTVPAGKVWEIKSAGAGGGGASIIINGFTVVLISNDAHRLPFWVPEGTIVSGGGVPQGLYSIIEYNVVP